ncbi:MAG: VCBS repeat-containing protein, partial [Candidatus Poribacteria bacterium]|nr:VCBS repeat-containing protein [Candidatus Poribacteria bacterium]
MSSQSQAFVSIARRVAHIMFRSLCFKKCVAGFAILCFSSDFVNAQPRLTDITATTEIHFRHEDGRSGAYYFLETLGAGAAWFDYDQDGDIDIYFVNGADLPGMKSDVPPTNALYRNDGDGTFTEVTDDAGVGDLGYGFSCTVGDYDNNGFPDIYITNFGANVLYRNNGDGTFADVTTQAKVGDSLWGASAAFADYDNDGNLDLFVANYVQFDIENNPECGAIGVRTHCGPGAFRGTASVLYRNNGDGTFADATEKAGVWNPNGKGMGVIWCDYDNDADLDLFVANDKVEDWLYRNEGDGTFNDVGLTSGVA